MSDTFLVADVDNDGLSEVFIANGDIDDFEFEGRSFWQLPQLLQQVARGRWNERHAKSLGDLTGGRDYLISEQLGGWQL